MDGEQPEAFKIEGLPFVMKKGEVVLDAVQDAQHYEFESRVKGMPWASARLRVAKGFYLGVGQLLSGPPQQTPVYIGGGTYILTSQRIFQATGS